MDSDLVHDRGTQDPSLWQEPYAHPSCWRLIASFQILVMC